jgi:alkanesulfonate monooxygenase
VVEQFARVDQACRAIGREPRSLLRSVWLTVCIGRDRAEFEWRAAAIGREPGDLKERGIAGLPGEARAALDRFEGAGVERVYLQFLDLDDLEHFDLVYEVLASGS